VVGRVRCADRKGRRGRIRRADATRGRVTSAVRTTNADVPYTRRTVPWADDASRAGRLPAVILSPRFAGERRIQPEGAPDLVFHEALPPRRAALDARDAREAAGQILRLASLPQNGSEAGCVMRTTPPRRHIVPTAEPAILLRRAIQGAVFALPSNCDARLRRTPAGPQIGSQFAGRDGAEQTQIEPSP
jgi:hypothetical protein